MGEYEKKAGKQSHGNEAPSIDSIAIQHADRPADADAAGIPKQDQPEEKVSEALVTTQVTHSAHNHLDELEGKLNSTLDQLGIEFVAEVKAIIAKVRALL